MQSDKSLIAGHKSLNAAQIGDMNMIKHLGKQCHDLIAYMEQENLDYDKRWIEVARTQLQLGLMSLTRTVAKTISFNAHACRWERISRADRSVARALSNFFRG